MRDIKTTIVGNATKDPVILRGGADPFSVHVRVAVSSRYFDVDTQRFENRRSEYFNVFVRRHMARHVLRSVHKGDPLIVMGRLGTSEWVNEAGETVHAMTIQAEAIGHDLTFGATTYTKADRFETPDIDPRSGVVLPPLPVYGTPPREAEIDEGEDAAALEAAEDQLPRELVDS